MNYKKIFSVTLVAGLLTMNTIPVFAQHSWIRKDKVIKSQVTEYKFKDVNLEWWKNYKNPYG